MSNEDVPQTWLQPELPIEAGRPRVEWMGFGPDMTDDAAREGFRNKYGLFPAEVRRTEGCVMAGPIPMKAEPIPMKENNEEAQ